MTAFSLCRMGLVVLSLLALASSVEGLWRKKEPPQPQPEEQQERSMGLVDLAGRAVWQYLAKYKFSIYLVTGYNLDQDLTIFVLSVICNVLYCGLIFAGFLVLPRNIMLAIGLLTVAVGPALVLVVLGGVVASIVMMAFYPMYTVAILWCFFFLQSQFFQKLGIALGLDVNGDGEVNMMDVLDYIATTKLGRRIHLDKLHFHLSSKRSVVELLNERFDQFEEKTLELLEAKMLARAESRQPNPNGAKVANQ